jgi:NDP-sugar pyrophosphorylase family protein
MSAGPTIAEVPVALLAGGLATRLRPVTEKVPKALVEVAGRPFIDNQLALFRKNGMRRVVVCLGHLGEQVVSHLGDGRRHRLEIAYSQDGPTPLGTGGALRRAATRLGEVFWVVYGDSYTDIDFPAVLDAFGRSGADGLMTVIRNADRWDRSNVEFARGQLLRYDKAAPTAAMTYIDYGVALLRRGVVDRLPEGKAVDLADVYRDLVAAGGMVGYPVPVRRRFYEIGTPAGLAETRAFLERRTGAIL